MVLRESETLSITRPIIPTETVFDFFDKFPTFTIARSLNLFQCRGNFSASADLWSAGSLVVFWSQQSCSETGPPERQTLRCKQDPHAEQEPDGTTVTLTTTISGQSMELTG